MERTRYGDVVDIVAGGMGERTGLPPACHAAVDELRIAAKGNIGSQSQPFHDAGPIAFEHDVRPLQERETECDGGRVLEIERQRAAPALGDLMRLRRRRVRAIDPQHVGAHVGEKHPAERAGTDAGEFHDTHTE